MGQRENWFPHNYGSKCQTLLHAGDVRVRVKNLRLKISFLQICGSYKRSISSLIWQTRHFANILCQVNALQSLSISSFFTHKYITFYFTSYLQSSVNANISQRRRKNHQQQIKITITIYKNKWLSKKLCWPWYQALSPNKSSLVYIYNFSNRERHMETVKKYQ